ncbi:hypothetical protein [Compostibacter hankyongensis]|uniref:Lipoprotein n=1 Tax=Compostibacter hankyongensis TaxID=1007089 RepID=A0ABP8G6S7_9BACT
MKTALKPSIIRPAGFLFPVIALGISLMLLSCKKDKSLISNKVYGTVIGFDPCTVVNNGGATGYLIELEELNAPNRIIDTVTTYNLPDLFHFTPDLFSRSAYLFPENLRNKFKFKLTYTLIPDNKKHYPICRADIFMYPIIGETQIKIIKTYGVVK